MMAKVIVYSAEISTYGSNKCVPIFIMHTNYMICAYDR